MNSAYAELLNMGEPQGKKSKLDSCNELLNSEDPDDQTLEETFVGSSDTDLVRVIEMGDFKGVEGVDQGVKLRTRQKLAEKELDRRRKLKSRTWRTQVQFGVGGQKKQEARCLKLVFKLGCVFRIHTRCFCHRHKVTNSSMRMTLANSR